MQREKLVEKMLEEEKKLTICCLSDSARRLDTMKRVLLELEGGKVICILPNQLLVTDAKYIFINCIRPENAKGMDADQVIIDFREPMRSIANEILRMSCVPEQYQIIDDRELGF